MTAPQPTASAARFPSEYGQTPELIADIQTWDEVAARIEVARNYLLASIGPGGEPYQRPIDGVFVEGALCFGGSPETRWVRNVLERRAVSISLPDDDHAVILSGTAELIEDPDAEISVALTPANRAKYPEYYTEGILSEFLPFFCLRPERVYAWSLTGFPARATRFDF